MAVYVLDTALEVEEANGVAAHRVVVRGTQPNRCQYPGGANARGVVGVTTDEAANARAVGIRRLGKALVEAAGVIAAGSKVCVADAAGRIKAAAAAAAVTGVVGNNNAIRWTSRLDGACGNAITVDIVVNGNNTPLSIDVTGNTVTINAATDGAGVATTTAADALAAIAADPAASLLIVGSHEDPSSGAAAVADETVILSGGEAGTNAIGVAEQNATQSGDLIDVFLTP